MKSTTAHATPSTIRRGGWKADEFDAYRAERRYPPILSTMMIRHDLPERPV